MKITKDACLILISILVLLYLLVIIKEEARMDRLLIAHQCIDPTSSTMVKSMKYIGDITLPITVYRCGTEVQYVLPAYIRITKGFLYE